MTTLATMTTLGSCFGLFLLAAAVGYLLNWLFSPSFRQTETEDATRTGATFHAAAWAVTLLIGFVVMAAGLILIDEIL